MKHVNSIYSPMPDGGVLLTVVVTKLFTALEFAHRYNEVDADILLAEQRAVARKQRRTAKPKKRAKR